MNARPAERLTRNQRIVIGVTALIFVAAVPFMWFNQQRRQPEIGPGLMADEIVIVPFRRLEPTVTEQLFTGKITLVISGSGQAGGTDYSDAFYLYQHGDGVAYDPPQLEHFDLEIDGQRAIYTLGLLENPPPYAPDHVYQVVYDVGPVPRQIKLRISDEIVDDNFGAFRIEIFPYPVPED